MSMHILILIKSEITQLMKIRVAYIFYKIENNTFQELLRYAECNYLIWSYLCKNKSDV